MFDQEEKCISSYLNFDWLSGHQRVDKDQHQGIHVPRAMTGCTYLSNDPQQVIDLTEDTTEMEMDLTDDTIDVEIDLKNDTSEMEIDLTNDTTDAEYKCEDLSYYLDYSWLHCKTSQSKSVKETSKALVEETSTLLVEETSIILGEETIQSLGEETSRSVVEKTSKRLVQETSKTLVEDTSKILVEETSQSLGEETSKTLVVGTSQSLGEETSKTVEETSNIVSIDAIYEQGHRSHSFSNSNEKKFEKANILPDQICYSDCDNIHPPCPFQKDQFNLECTDMDLNEMLTGNSDDLFYYSDITKAVTKCSTTEHSPAHSCNIFCNDSTVNDSTVLYHCNITDNTNDHTERDIPYHRKKMAVLEGECGVQEEELVDIGDIAYQHSSYKNTKMSSDKVGNWEENYSTLPVLPTIYTDVCDNIKSQNDSEINDSNVTELANGNVFFEKTRSEARNSQCSVINEQVTFDDIPTIFEDKLDSSFSISLQIPDTDLNNIIDFTNNEHQCEYKLSENGDRIMGKNINVMSNENDCGKTTPILKESSWQNELTLNQEKYIPVGNSLKQARSDKIVNFDDKFGKIVTKSLTKSSDFSSHLMNQKGRWRIILDRPKTSSHNSQLSKQNVSVYDSKKPDRHLVQLERNDTRDRLSNTECLRKDIDKDDIDECYKKDGDNEESGDRNVKTEDFEDGRNTECGFQNIEDGRNTECSIQNIENGRNTECSIQNIENGRNTECSIQNIEDSRNTDCGIHNIGVGDSMNNSYNIESYNTTVCTENSNVDILKKGHSCKDIDKENAHIKSTDSRTNKSILCQTCPGFVTSTITNMIAHENTTFHCRRKYGESGLKLKKYECNVCSCRFGRPHTLRIHYQRQHAKYRAEGDTKNCMQCNKYRRLSNEGRLNHEASAGYSALKTHFKSHVARNCASKQADDHSCEICYQPFSSKQSLDDHMTTHFENNSNKCLLCDRDFSNRQSLVDHIPIHSDTQVNQNKDENDFISNFNVTEKRGSDCMEIKILNLPVSQNWKNIHWKKSRKGHSKITKAVCKTCPNFTAFSSHMMKLHEQMTFHIRNTFGDIGLRLLKHECHVCSARFKYRDNKRNHFKRRHLQQLAETAINVSVNQDSGCDNNTVEQDGTCDYENRTNQSANGTERQDNIPVDERKIHNKKTRREKDINTMHQEYEAGIRSKMSRNGTYNQQEPIITNTEEHLNKCDLCDQSFSSEKCLDNHMISHFESTTFKCELCKMDFGDWRTLINHIPIHNTPKVPCDLCTRFFISEDELRLHKMGYHHETGNDRFECVVCRRVFKSEQWLNQHIKNIHIDKIFTCQTCGKVFRGRDTLRNHRIAMHTKDYPCRCHICGKGFVLPCLLKQHILEHDGKEIYECNICNDKFSVKWKFSRHVSKHKIEKSENNAELMFVCEICGKKFVRNSNLQLHLKVHSGDKSYKCEICGRSFGRSDNLYTHMRSHTGQKPYCCDTCGKQFARGDNLKTHIRKMHF